MSVLDLLKVPLNVEFIFSFIVTVLLTLLIIPVGKRRPPGTPLSWGEAMFAAVYVFFLLFMAYGVVPHQWLNHADNNLRWRKDAILYGPGNILKPQGFGGNFPFTISYQEVRDLIAVLIYAVFLGLQIFVWVRWQKRGKAKPSAEVATSTYGRPLVRKG
jgi:hypothetical protein